jgi:hypothetical protein
MIRIPRGKYRARLLSFLTASLVFIVGFHGTAANSFAQAKKQTVIFAVQSEAGEGSLDAIAILEAKKLRAPYPDEQKDRQTSFANDYFKKGAVYRLIFGGGDAGSATISKWSEGCNNIHAQATVSTSARLGGKVMALATNSETLGKRAISRRPPTEAERAATLALMKSIYQQRRTPASLISAIKITNLTASDLNGDGKVDIDSAEAALNRAAIFFQVPELNVTVGAGSVSILWPATWTNWVLQANADLSRSNWFSVNTVLNNGTKKSSTTPVSSSNLFLSFAAD